MIYIALKQSKHITYDESSYIQIYLVSWRRSTRERVSGPFFVLPLSAKALNRDSLVTRPCHPRLNSGNSKLLSNGRLLLLVYPSIHFG
jgi:hypothetical protein